MKKQIGRHQFVYLPITIIAFIFASSALASAQDKLAKDYRGNSVTKQLLIKNLKAGELRDSEITEVVRENGVNFSLQPADEEELKVAGAGSELIAAVRENYFVSLGVVNGKATNLIVPAYPSAAGRAGGAVNVAVLIDENGNVIKAHAVSGNTLLKTAAEAAARASKFSPPILSGKKIRASGVIVYNFVAP